MPQARCHWEQADLSHATAGRSMRCGARVLDGRDETYAAMDKGRESPGYKRHMGSRWEEGCVGMYLNVDADGAI